MKHLNYTCDSPNCHNEADNLNHWLTIGTTDEKSLEIENKLKDNVRLANTTSHGDLHLCSQECLNNLFFHSEKLPKWNNQAEKDYQRELLLAKIEMEFGPGCAAICKERARQKEVKGYKVSRDSKFYNDEQLADAAVAYALDPNDRPSSADRFTYKWPWDPKFWNPTPENRTREFEKAGALLAAQLDVNFHEKK